jgi:hypothetical protein
VSSADLINVQDIAVRKSGLLQAIFDFGDVVCQTAGTEGRFVLSAVPHPAEVLGIIDRTRDAARTQYQRAALHDRFDAGVDQLAGHGRPPVPEFRPGAAPPDNVSARMKDEG